MATITIDNKPFEVQEQVASLLRETQDQNKFYRTVLCWIAWNEFQGPAMKPEAIKTLAEEAVRLYR
jgi:hypothetical protein